MINRLSQTLFNKCITILATCAILFSVTGTAHAAASMSLTSSKTTYQVDDTFTVNVNVFPNTESVIVARARISYPTTLLDVVAYSQNGLFENRSPGETIGNGIINIGGFNLQEGTTNSGVLGTVTFKAKAPGTATLLFLSGSHLIDEEQNDVYGGGSGITLTIGGEEPPPPEPEEPNDPSPEEPTEIRRVAPAVYSETHPDEDAWYQDRNATLCWPRLTGQTGYALTLNKTPNTDPGSAIDTRDTCFSFEEVTTLTIDDGIWYFTIKAQYGSTFSPYSTFRVQLDNAAPEPFPVFFETVSADEDGTNQFQLVFAATDDLSGIDHYELRRDENDERVTITSPYRLTAQDLEAQTLTVYAIDNGGNETASIVDMTDPAIREQLDAAPYIEPPTVRTPFVSTNIVREWRNLNLFFRQEGLIISGTAEPSTQIFVFIDQQDRPVGATVAQTNETWQYSHEQVLPLGEHRISALAQQESNRSSLSPEKTVHLVSDFTARKQLRPWVYIALIIIGLLLLVILIIEFIISHLHRELKKSTPASKSKKKKSPAKKPTKRKKKSS